jgi:L-seryl-tRNA(Ser) seleniumtransferase
MANEYQRLPKVDRVALHPNLAAARARLGVEAVTRLARRAIDAARRAVVAGESAPSLEETVQRVEAAAAAQLRLRARPVINATGVLLHTNLGRAPLAHRAVEALAASAGHATSVEIDLATGRRGARGAFAEQSLAELCGAESALVVNNNAAAVLLALSALTAGKRVLVSRGELIEIGGGFRVPDVCARSGAELIEVGTTNKTRLSDYERAIDAGGVGAILRVHQGNFRQIGFVERPDLSDLAKLAHARGVLLIKDLGGGALVDLSATGLVGEPLARPCVEAGCDVVCFSTDKVLGGPQGGAIVGARDYVEKARRDPLARALRLGRLPLVALEATIALYLEGAVDEIPVLAAARMPIDEVKRRAESWADSLSHRGVESEVVALEGAMGGGTLAESPLPSFGIALSNLSSSVDAVAECLRVGEPSVVARIAEGRLLFDARSVQAVEAAPMLDAIVAALAPIQA